MPELVVCVVDDPEKAEDVLGAWVELGVPGVTILDSTGLGHHMSGLGAADDVPLFPSLESLLRAREESHRTLLAVVNDTAAQRSAGGGDGAHSGPAGGARHRHPVRRAG